MTKDEFITKWFIEWGVKLMDMSETVFIIHGFRVVDAQYGLQVSQLGYDLKPIDWNYVQTWEQLDQLLQLYTGEYND